MTSLICAIRQRPSGGRQAARLGDLLRRVVRLLDQPVADGVPVQAAQRGHQVLLRAAPAAGLAAGHDVGLDVDHQLGYLLGGSAALVMALPRSRAGKLDGDVLTGPLAWGPACGSTRGATVSGIDTTPALLDIVRERVPSASLAIADLEDPLPFDAGEFNVVTAFNSVQYAADPVAAPRNSLE